MRKSETQVATEDVEMGQSNMWGIFDEDDLCDDTPEAMALFRTEDEAKGFLLLIGPGGCITPVVRPCVVRGSVNVEKR